MLLVSHLNYNYCRLTPGSIFQMGDINQMCLVLCLPDRDMKRMRCSCTLALVAMSQSSTAERAKKTPVC